MDGTRVDSCWIGNFPYGGVCGEGVQQHFGGAATGICFRECAIVCDVHAGNVLEADDGARGVLGAAGRNSRRGGALLIDADGGSGLGSERRVSGADSAYLCERDGAEFLDGDFRLGRVLYTYGRYFPTDYAAPGRGIERAGVFADGETGRGWTEVASEAFHAGVDCAGAACRLESDFLVEERGLRAPYGQQWDLISVCRSGSS